MQRIKKLPLFAGLIILFFLVWKGVPALLNTEVGQKIIPPKKTQQSLAIKSLVLPDAPKNIQSTAPSLPLPSNSTASFPSNNLQTNYEIWAWNAQMGLIFANGGPETTKGSIMEKRGVNLKLIRQDDSNKMQADLIKFARAYQANPNSREGVQFISNMGDGDPAFLKGINDELLKLDNGNGEYIAQIVGSLGRSFGEDKYMASQKIKDDPQAAKGTTVAAVLRDGDWNIVIEWAAANNIKVNPDETTFDPDAINFINAETYIDAAQKYINGYTEERPVAQNGKINPLEGKHKVTVDGVATWTPGDVMIAQKKGGLVSVVSTAEYSAQMPCAVIGIKKFMKDNPKLVENLLAGAFEGGDQVKGYKDALKKGAEISAAIYKEENAEYWMMYYTGKQVADAKGQVVSLGGSRANNLADNLEYFGLNPGSTDIFTSVYHTFGDIDVSLYPKLVPNYPDYDQVVDLTYLKNVASTFSPSQITAPDVVKYNTEAGIVHTTSQRPWSITFNTGKATFTSAAIVELNKIKAQGLIAKGLQIRIEGHTDNVGSASLNQTLSEARANAVRDWLIQQAPNAFNNRINTAGFGPNHPVLGCEQNATETQRAKNRRVEVVFGS